jgi:hypothetical protein
MRSLSQNQLLQRVGTDEHLDTIASLLDDMFRIPGTKIRFGLDAIIGWIPGIGDAAAGIASFLIVFAAWRRGTPGITLARMIANVVLETLVGAIPIVGDIFHVIWKANRRNSPDARKIPTQRQQKSRLALPACYSCHCSYGVLASLYRFNLDSQLSFVPALRARSGRSSYMWPNALSVESS